MKAAVCLLIALLPLGSCRDRPVDDALAVGILRACVEGMQRQCYFKGSLTASEGSVQQRELSAYRFIETPYARSVLGGVSGFHFATADRNVCAYVEVAEAGMIGFGRYEAVDFYRCAEADEVKIGLG